MDIVEIHDLPQAVDIQDGYELPISTGPNPGDVKRLSIALLKTWIIAFVGPMISSISQGPQGIQGVPGIQGPQGVPGVTGQTGAQGTAGTRGAVGPAGPTGIQGPIGQTGLKGDKGADGAQGIQGPAGADGVQGPPGADGGNFDMAAYIEAAPVCDNEAAAVTAGLSQYTFYKTSTGELRYKLPDAPTPVTPAPPTNGIVNDTADTFTYTGGEA